MIQKKQSKEVFYMEQDSRVLIPAGTGYLIVQVSTASGAIPLSGAIVTVRDYDPESEPERGNVIASMRTDRSGKTQKLALPAPERTLSQSPGSAVLPYALYSIDVKADRYFENYFASVPIFDGIVAVQPAVLQALPDSKFSDNAGSDTQIFFESQNPDL
jgi:hypothetical protein